MRLADVPLEGWRSDPFAKPVIDKRQRLPRKDVTYGEMLELSRLSAPLQRLGKRRSPLQRIELVVLAGYDQHFGPALLILFVVPIAGYSAAHSNDSAHHTWMRKGKSVVQRYRL